MRGTLAWAIENGEEALPRGATLPKPDRRSAYEQLADIQWNWLRQLIAVRVYQVGLGPW